MLSRRKTFWLAILLSTLIGCNSSYSSGDRVIVAKDPYDAGIGLPNRFDVVVFRFPGTGGSPGPTENNVPKNYIKRLMGLPGQLLAIFFGQIYFYEPPAGGPPFFKDSVGAYLGVTSDNANEGARITDVLKDSPARKAGLTADDVIVQAGTHNVVDAVSLQEAMWASKPGEKIKFKVRRDHQLQDVDVVLGSPALKIWEKPYMHVDDPRSKKLWDEPGKFQIVRKTPEVMLAMRRIVYDHNFPTPKGDPVLVEPRWKPAVKEGWTPDDTLQHGFTNAGATANNDVDWLHYQHILYPFPGAQHGPRKELIADLMGYNMSRPGTPDPMRAGLKMDWDPSVNSNWVGNLIIECQVDASAASGEFWLELNKGIYRYQACFDLATGKCTLYQLAMDDTRKELGKADTRVKGPGKYKVRFANIDARLTVWVDDDLPFGDGVAYAPPEVRAEGEANLTQDELIKRRGPTENDLTPASIGSRKAHVNIRDIRLWRDTYYTINISPADAPDWRNFADAMQHGLDAFADNKPDAAKAAFEDARRLEHDSPAATDALHQVTNFIVLTDERQKNEFGTRLKDLSKYVGWHKYEPLANLHEKIMYVQPGHYLCLGDNSPFSSDSRDWGLVPQRLMLGRALMVYWPYDRAGPIR